MPSKFVDDILQLSLNAKFFAKMTTHLSRSENVYIGYRTSCPDPRRFGRVPAGVVLSPEAAFQSHLNIRGCKFRKDMNGPLEIIRIDSAVKSGSLIIQEGFYNRLEVIKYTGEQPRFS